METFRLHDAKIGTVTMNSAIKAVNDLADSQTTGNLVTFVNIHMLVEARKNPRLARALQESSLNCPDGRPIFWVGRFLLGLPIQQVAGPDFMRLFCRQSVARGDRHFLYGGAPGVVKDAAATLRRLYPGIQIVGTYSPPFRPLIIAEDEAVCAEINSSGANLIWVCLGCPKQEIWIEEHRHRLHCNVLLAVGQAIDVLAQYRKRAPKLLRVVGFEWLYRLFQEPARLWKRYLITNALFVIWTIRDLYKMRRVFFREPDL